VCLEIGTRSAEDVTLYSDIDMKIDKKAGGGFTIRTNAVLTGAVNRQIGCWLTALCHSENATAAR